MRLIIIIPCLNEEKTILNVISLIPKKIIGISNIEILVIDDGSTDNTAELAKKAGASVISHKINRGVGTAFHTGVEESIKRGADIVVNMDGDGQFNPEDIEKLIAPILDNNADCVTASRFKDKTFYPKMPFIKKWGNVQMARLISFLTGKKYYDVSCGFRAYSKETILRMNLFGKFTYTQETFLDLAFKNMEIVEVPLKVRGEREFGKSRVASNILKYAINTSKIILRAFRDYKPLKFFAFLGTVFLILGFCLGGFFIYHYMNTGVFSGQLWAGFSGGFSILFSFLFFLTGLLGDMLVRIRNNQEKLLYLERVKSYNSVNNNKGKKNENFI
jgi:glycosyltransferase involved in cell wall biosynthesis